VEINMSTLTQPRLNRSFVLRYDHAHETDSVEGNNADEEFDAEIDAILLSKGFSPSSDGLRAQASNSLSTSSNGLSQCGETGSDHMDVNSISGVGRAQPLGGIRPTQEIDTPATNALAPQDEVQISSAAQAMDELGQTSDVRMERIRQIQQEIADGVYDSDEKLDAALDRFLDAYDLNDD
jgi:negative regulator of flagellin synthesis FlgM